VTWLSSSTSEVKPRYIAAIWASEGSTWIAGTWASGGRSARTWSTRELMSASASAALKFSLRRTLIVDSPSTLCDSM